MSQPLENIGVDEPSFQKRHEYLTVAYDCDRKQQVGDDALGDPSSTAQVRLARRPSGS